jgi:hypothetical protein
MNVDLRGWRMRRIVRKKKGHSVLAVLVLPQLSMKFMLHQKEGVYQIIYF